MPTAPAGTQPPAVDAPLSITQADLDRIINTRLEKDRSAQNKKFAELFGGANPDAPVDPVEALADAQALASTNRDMAVAATAESLAVLAGIKPERVATFTLIAQQSGLFKNVDLADPAARTALKAAVEAKANEFPEWKGTALPSASGGDRQTAGQPTIDERIATAQSAGDWKLAISLKRLKMTQP